MVSSHLTIIIRYFWYLKSIFPNSPFDYTIPPDLRNDQQVYLCPHYMHFRQTEIEREREKKSLTCPFGFVVLVVVEVVVVVVAVVDTGNCPWSI